MTNPQVWARRWEERHIQKCRDTQNVDKLLQRNGRRGWCAPSKRVWGKYRFLDRNREWHLCDRLANVIVQLWAQVRWSIVPVSVWGDQCNWQLDRDGRKRCRGLTPFLVRVFFNKSRKQTMVHLFHKIFAVHVFMIVSFFDRANKFYSPAWTFQEKQAIFCNRVNDDQL
jgi:hypothetical protein